MKFTLRIPSREETYLTLDRAARSARKAAAGLAGAAQAGAGALERRAEDAVNALRLRQTIRDLEEEIGLQLRAVGELVYATHRGTPSDSEDLQEILEYVDSLREELEAHQRELRTMAGERFCPACGEANDGANAYCHNCGVPLAEEA